MSVLKAMIRRQAQMAKADTANREAAELIKQAQQKLAQAEQFKIKASQLTKEDKTEIRGTRVQRFATALAQGKADETKSLVDNAHADLTNAGWKRTASTDDGKAMYMHPGKPDHQLMVDGNQFAVMKGLDVVQPKTHLSGLKDFLGKTPAVAKPVQPVAPQAEQMAAHIKRLNAAVDLKRMRFK